MNKAQKNIKWVKKNNTLLSCCLFCCLVCFFFILHFFTFHFYSFSPFSLYLHKFLLFLVSPDLDYLVLQFSYFFCKIKSISYIKNLILSSEHNNKYDFLIYYVEEGERKYHFLNVFIIVFLLLCAFFGFGFALFEIDFLKKQNWPTKDS